MPPRRSSRSTQASVEPVSAEILPAKRKRAQPVESDTEDKEPVNKPASRARRSTSARASTGPASKGRTSSKSQPALPEVPETDDDDEEDSPPPVKKSRPSANVKEEEDSDFEEKPKGKRTAAPSKKGKGRATSVASKAGSSSTRSGRTSRAAAVEDSADKGENRADKEEEEDEDEVEPAPKPKARTRAVRANGRASTRNVSKTNGEEDMYLSDEPTSSKGQKTAPAVNDGDETMGEAAGVNEGHVSEEEEEDEHSLFDPIPMPAASTLPTTMPEEPAGPKSRLVIHKMALVNFKSYAGRQEIGPFHKVMFFVVVS